MSSSARSLWRKLRQARHLDKAIDEEMRFHIEMEAERLMRERGLGADEARRLAHVAFGGLEKYKDEGREVAGLRWIGAGSLDARLAVRMLIKQRWLTLVGGFAMTVAIAIGAMAFQIMTETLEPALPLQGGDRGVALQYATATPGSPERRLLHDFVDWREELRSVEHVGAFRLARYNLVSRSGPPEPVWVAEISAPGFALAGTPALVGRYLLPADENAAAPPVIVIGHEAWQSRFGGDPQIVGRSITLNGRERTVVGVRPPGFRFPLDEQITDVSLGRATALLFSVAAIMTLVGSLAALGPARRSLRIHAVDALRADG